MIEKTCYKEDSLQDFAEWATQCGHYSVAPLIENYQEFIKNVRSGEPEPAPEDN
jgi:hypothetical protein